MNEFQPFRLAKTYVLKVLRSNARMYVLGLIGYKVGLVYENNSVNRNDQNENKERKRDIIWWKPPHSANVKKNIGRYFVKLLNNHFLRENKFFKLLNKNAVKISYKSLENISSLLALYKCYTIL